MSSQTIGKKAGQKGVGVVKEMYRYMSRKMSQAKCGTPKQKAMRERSRKVGARGSVVSRLQEDVTETGRTRLCEVRSNEA